jgi:hypothetical protein
MHRRGRKEECERELQPGSPVPYKYSIGHIWKLSSSHLKNKTKNMLTLTAHILKPD